MSGDIRLEYEADQSVTTEAVRDSLAELTDDDVSVGSPVSAGVPEAGIGFSTYGDYDRLLNVAVEGHEGDFTKTSHEALEDAIESVEGVGEQVRVEGGYESGSDGDDGDDESDGDESAE